MSTVLIILIILALLFDFLNGFHDSSNIVATMISSRSIRPNRALIMTAIGEFIGPFLFGVAVAKTIGEEVVTPETISLSVIFSTILAAIFWNLLTWYLGIPSSSSHALIGGLIGSVAITTGFGSIHLPGIIKILISLFVSPIIGLTVGYLMMRLVLFLARNSPPKINWFFKKFQVVTALSLALSHGANDAQKTMGIITLALVTTGYLESFSVPFWVITLSAAAISMGTLVGGWRLIKTLGGKLYKIRPVHAFSSQIASASVILGAAMLGGPVSTTHVVSTAIMGVGSAERINKVRWGVAADIAWTWVLTIPSAAIVAALINLVLAQIPVLNIGLVTQ